MEGVKVPIPAQPQKFLDQFRAFIRLDGKSYATENTYVYWVRQYILYHQKKHPSTLGFFGMGYIIVRDGKGAKDRTTLLPKATIPDLKNQLIIVKNLLETDIKNGVGPVYMPYQLEKKYPDAGRSLAWQYVFPSENISQDPRVNVMRRHHLYSTTLQGHVKKAIKAARINKLASCHTFRHSFATRLLQSKYDLKQIQTLMGHSDIRTTEIYLHVLDELGDKVKSPLDD